MPTPASVKLLYEEGQNERQNDITTWSVGGGGRPRARSRCGPCVAVTAAICMLIIGFILGAFLHACAFPKGGSPISAFSFGDAEENVQTTTETFDSTTLDDDDVTTTDWESTTEETTTEENENTTTPDEDDEAEENASEEKRENSEIVISEEKEVDAEKDEELEGADEEEVEDKLERLLNDEGDNDECEDFPWSDRRIPSDVIPTAYNLTLHPNISSNSLQGSVAIDLKIAQRTKLIVLHADTLELSAFEINVDGKKIEAEFKECAERFQWAFELEEEIEKGDQVSLAIDFEGEVHADLNGLYITTHTDANGRKTKSLVTQFEPSYARKMFPCFDEPNFKATFEVSVIREAHHVVRSNMNLRVTKEHVDGLYIDVFYRSVRMSTYLLALAVLEEYDYAKKSTKTTERVIETRLYAPKDVLKGQSEFGLTTAVKALEYFEDYFNISYPLEKIDLVALDDFSEGAMENWGLVTFRDSALLHGDSHSSLTKEHIALVMCHEIAHQWFGNLVTMSWWNDLWLNEGFANYMEYRCVDHIFPDWNIMNRFYAENVAFSQDPDGLRSSRAVSSGLVQNITNIMSLFDAISYHKAAAIIHMISSLAGEKAFQKALIEYLNKFAYQNAQGIELWKIVEKHAQVPDGVSIHSLADAFISQEGYPVVRVELKDNHILIHNQTRFLFDGSTDDAEWPLPIHYRTNVEEESKLAWLKPKQKSVKVPAGKSVSWVIANSGGVGYFKVLYDEKIYKELTKQLKKNHKEISSIDRSMILADAFDLSKTELLDINIYLDLLTYADEEEERMTWNLMNKQLKTIDSLIEETAFAHLFKDFQRTLFMRVYEQVAWKNNTNKGLQAELVQLACRLRHRDCTKHALAQYNEWTKDSTKSDPELLGVAVAEGVRQGSVAAWENVLASYQEARSPSEKQQLIGALAVTTDSTLIHRLLRYCVEGVVFRPNVVPRVFAALSQNPMARTHAWRFFRIHSKQFTKLLGKTSSLLIGTIRYMVEKRSTEEDLHELKHFLTEQKLDENNSKLKQIIEQIKLNIQWRKLNEAGLRQWLGKWDEQRRKLQRARRSA